MKSMIAVFAVCLAGSVMGCIPPPNDYEVCNSYGLSPGGDGGFAQCMGQRQQNRMQAAQMFLNRPQPQPYQVPFHPISMPGPVITNCSRTGSFVNCSSY